MQPVSKRRGHLINYILLGASQMSICNLHGPITRRKYLLFNDLTARTSKKCTLIASVTCDVFDVLAVR